MINTNLRSEKKKLILFDHDGTICYTKTRAYESLIYALKEALKLVEIDFENQNVDVNGIFTIETGTTEKNLVRAFAFAYNVPFLQFEKFEDEFYRSRTNWYEYLKIRNYSLEEEYYSDSIDLITELRKDPTNLIGIVTGNPSSVFDLRKTNFVADSFTKTKEGRILGAYGEEDFTREGLIELAIERAEREFQFNTSRDYLKFATNVWYIADTQKDLYSCLNAKCRFIWVPTRSLPKTQDLKYEDHIRYLCHLFGSRITVTNKLDTPEIFKILSL
jgi:phosphoglycolate phosphatase-like HAD superfamily hydrolase